MDEDVSKIEDEIPSPKRRQQCHAAAIETLIFHAEGKILKSTDANACTFIA